MERIHVREGDTLELQRITKLDIRADSFSQLKNLMEAFDKLRDRNDRFIFRFRNAPYIDGIERDITCIYHTNVLFVKRNDGLHPAHVLEILGGFVDQRTILEDRYHDNEDVTHCATYIICPDLVDRMVGCDTLVCSKCKAGGHNICNERCMKTVWSDEPDDEFTISHVNSVVNGCTVPGWRLVAINLTGLICALILDDDMVDFLDDDKLNKATTLYTWKQEREEEKHNEFKQYLSELQSSDSYYDKKYKLGTNVRIQLNEEAAIQRDKVLRNKTVLDFSAKQRHDGKFTITFMYDGKIKMRVVEVKSYNEALALAEEVHKILHVNQYESDDVQAKQIAAKYIGDASTYVSLIHQKDNEINFLMEEVNKLKKELYNKDAIIEHLQNKGKRVQQDNIIVNELYEGELDYHIHKAVKNYINSSIGSTLSRGMDLLRKYNETEYVDKSNEIRKQLENILTGIKPSSPNFGSMLHAIGFDTRHLGNNHVSVYPIDHPEYSVAIASTPSDSYRAGMNAAGQICKMLFQ